MKTKGQQTSIGLIGRYEMTVIEDGRLILPSNVVHLLQAADVRKLYPAQIPGLKALVLCPEQFWARWIDHLETLFPSLTTHPDARAYTTPFKPIGWDSHGRISLPALAHNYAGLKVRGTAVLFGKDYYLELWAEEEFRKMKEACESALRRADQPQRDSEDSEMAG